MMTEDTRKLALSVDEAAGRAGVGRDKIYESVRTGKLRARKMGRRTLVLTSDLESFLNDLPPIEPVA